MKKLLFLLLPCLLLCISPRLHAQPDGVMQGYNGEWNHTKSQILALAEATPQEKYSWRPAPGVRSISEVYMHIAIANFYYVGLMGIKTPDVSDDKLETSVTKKADVIDWLKRSFAALEAARAQLKPGDLDRKLKVWDMDVTVDDIYLRAIIHNAEHMGQAIAYARMNGIVPPWSKPAAK
jgi:uncharacterized damage-inducible protein DinB